MLINTAGNGEWEQCNTEYQSTYGARWNEKEKMGKEWRRDGVIDITRTREVERVEGAAPAPDGEQK